MSEQYVSDYFSKFEENFYFAYILVDNKVRPLANNGNAVLSLKQIKQYKTYNGCAKFADKHVALVGYTNNYMICVNQLLPYSVGDIVDRGTAINYFWSTFPMVDHTKDNNNSIPNTVLGARYTKNSNTITTELFIGGNTHSLYSLISDSDNKNNVLFSLVLLLKSELLGKGLNVVYSRDKFGYYLFSCNDHNRYGLRLSLKGSNKNGYSVILSHGGLEITTLQGVIDFLNHCDKVSSETDKANPATKVISAHSRGNFYDNVGLHLVSELNFNNGDTVTINTSNGKSLVRVALWKDFILECENVTSPQLPLNPQATSEVIDNVACNHSEYITANNVPYCTKCNKGLNDSEVEFSKADLLSDFKQRELLKAVVAYTKQQGYFANILHYDLLADLFVSLSKEKWVIVPTNLIEPIEF